MALATVTNYNAIAKTVTLTGSIGTDNLTSIVNQTRGRDLFVAGRTPITNRSFDGTSTVFTLDTVTTGDSNSDLLVVRYQAPNLTGSTINANNPLPTYFVSTPTVNLGTTGAIATAAKQDTGNSSLSSIDAKLPTLISGNFPVALTSSQIATLTPLSTVAVTGTFWQATQPVSLVTLPALATGSNAIGSITNTIFASTQSGTWNLTNISGTISLPTLASTSTLQTTGNASLSSIDTKLPSNLTVTSTRLLVDSFVADSIYLSNSVVFTRAANTTAYIAGDVYGTKVEITNFGVANGGFVLTSVDGVSSLASLPSGMGSFRLFLFTSEPSAITDNAAFTLATSSLTPKGILLDTLAVVTNAVGATLQTDLINIIRRRGSGNLWAYLVTQAAFTPAAATADTLTLTIRGVAT